MTKTKAVLKKGVEPKIQHPTGILDKQINSDDLVKNPEKYVNVYPSFYENVNAVKHEVNTRSTVKKSLGSKTRVVRSKANNGLVYNVFAGAPKPKKETPVRNLEPKKTLQDASIEAELKSKDDLIAALQAQLQEANKKPKASRGRKKAAETKEDK